MKIAAVKKFTQVLVAMAVAAVMAALLCAPKALGTTIGEFSIEQIYVNVPELDVFVQATDAQGQPISPDLVRAAGVELYLGDEKIPTGNIGMANEPICYVLAVDNSVDETTLKETDFFYKDRNYRAFIVVFVGDVRLIDNMHLD